MWRVMVWYAARGSWSAIQALARVECGLGLAADFTADLKRRVLDSSKISQGSRHHTFFGRCVPPRPHFAVAARMNGTRIGSCKGWISNIEFRAIRVPT